MVGGNQGVPVAAAIQPGVREPLMNKAHPKFWLTKRVSLVFGSVNALLFAMMYLSTFFGPENLETAEGYVYLAFPFLFSWSLLRASLGYPMGPFWQFHHQWTSLAFLTIGGVASWAALGGVIGFAYELWRDWFNAKFLEGN